jgi:hypothetical protein
VAGLLGEGFFGGSGGEGPGGVRVGDEGAGGKILGGSDDWMTGVN